MHFFSEIGALISSRCQKRAVKYKREIHVFYKSSLKSLESAFFSDW